MGNSSEMILGVLPSLGGSVASQKKDGREGLFLKYYIPQYLKFFDFLHYFSYASKEDNLINDKVHICQNRLGFNRYLYALLLVFFQHRLITRCSLLRVMHMNGALPAILAKVFFRIPFVATYGYDYAGFAAIEGHPIKAVLLKLVLPLFIRFADGVIVTTEELTADVQKRAGDKAKIFLVPNGVDTAYFRPIEKPLNKKAGEPFQILTVGRLEKQKNPFFFLDIISKLRRHKNIQVLWIGSGSLENSLKNRVAAENLPVHFLSRVPYEKMVDYYRLADIYLSASLAEGHPKALLEAMSCGLICVVSECPGHTSLIEQRKNGFLLNTGDVNLWTETLIQIMEHLAEYENLRKATRDHIIANYDIRITLEKELDLLIQTSRKIYGGTEHTACKK